MTDEAVQEVASRTGVDQEKVRDLAQRTVVNVLPKAVGVKLRRHHQAELGRRPRCRVLHRAPHRRADPAGLPSAETLVASTVMPNQPAVEIEIWEQAGEFPSPDLAANHRVDDAGLIEGLGQFSLPAGSPVNIEMKVDEEGTVKLHAVEPTSGSDLRDERADQHPFPGAGG